MRAVFHTVLGLVTFACAVASCAGSEDTADTAEAGSPSPELDATSDAPSDADCVDADGGGCSTTELSCAEADFCAVPGAVDGRYALLDVWGSSDRDVWAVGAGGTVIHWDGAAWTTVPLPWKDTLRSVGGSGVSDVWIVSSPNLILHSTGFGTAAGFTLQPSIDPSDTTNYNGAILTKVWAAGAGALFVGGPLKPGQNDSLWRFRFGAGADVPSWEPVSTFCRGRLPGEPCPGVASIWGMNDTDVWVVGERGGLRRSTGPVGDGGGADQWTTVDSTLTIADLHGIWGSSSSDVWIVGDAGTLRHWSDDGSQRWEIIASPTTKNLRAVWGTGANDVWAVGDAGTILHWDGQHWSSVTTTLPPGPKPHLYGVWGSGPNDVWAVGEGVVLHFSGMKSPATPIADGGAR